MTADLSTDDGDLQEHDTAKNINRRKEQDIKVLLVSDASL